MNHQISFNPFRGGNKGSVSSLPLSEYDKTIGYPWLRQMVAQIRGDVPIYGKRQLGANGKVTVEEPLTGEPLKKEVARIKSQLPFRCAHYAAFRDNKRRQANILPETFLYQTTVDVDEKDLVETALEMAKLLDNTPGTWKGKLLHLEYSARKKLHIDIRMPIGMTIEEAQRAYCEALGVPCDESCFSPERIIFITDKDSEIYRSPEWYAILDEDTRAQYQEAFRKRGLDVDGRANNPNNSNNPNNTNNSNNPIKNENQQLPSGGVATSQAQSVSDTGSHQPSPVGGPQVPLDSPAHPTDSDTPAGVGGAAPDHHRSLDGSHPISNASLNKNLIAFDLFQEKAGLRGVDINAEGSRHSSLLAIMSAGASRVMNADALQRVVEIRMPSFAQEHDCKQLIRDFYERYCDSTKPMSREVMNINANAERMAYSASGQENSSLYTLHSSLSSDESEEEYPAPPPMPEKLPKLVKLLVSKTPDIYKPAVANAIFPPLATHLWKTTFRYIDNVDHEATLMCALLAGTGAGKNCVQMPINLIMADIRKRDQENLAREKAWKDEVTRKGANKDKRKRPENLIIQEIDADMTNPAFVMRTAEAQDHFLYTSLNEIDQFDALKGQGQQQFRIMCLAFDPGNQYGQTRVGTQSVTERVCIRFNWNASTTIQKGQRYFARVLTDGPISRINFCTIPEREIGADMPIYGTYDEAFTEALRPYIENLCRATGSIDCPEAYQLALKLKDENADFARMTQSRIYENLSFRANVIAYLKACVLYVANGCQWEREIDEFIRWSERYDLWCKMRFFGDAIAKADNEGVKSSKRGPRNMLQQLPDEFTLHDVVSIRLENGLDQKGTGNMLRTWIHRGYIRRKYDSTMGNGTQEGSNQAMQGSNQAMQGSNQAMQGSNQAMQGSNQALRYSCDSFEKLKFRRDGREVEC